MKNVATGSSIARHDPRLIAPRVRTGAPAAEQRLGELMRLGLLTPARSSPKARLPRRRPVTTEADLLRDLDESRADR